MSQNQLRPDARAYLDAMAAQPRPPMNDATIAMMRQVPPEMIEGMLLMFERPLGELGEVRDVNMPGPGGDIALRLFDPRKDRGPGPVVVFYHGGGFVAGSIGTHAPLAAEIARQLDLPVISVEYRLAPEHKWPAAPDDAEAAARWIAENGAAFGREFTGLVTCGDSAGGTLTLVTTMALRDRPAALPVRAADTDLSGQRPLEALSIGQRIRARFRPEYARHRILRCCLWFGQAGLARLSAARRPGGPAADAFGYGRFRSACAMRAGPSLPRRFWREWT